MKQFSIYLGDMDVENAKSYLHNYIEKTSLSEKDVILTSECDLHNKSMWRKYTWIYIDLRKVEKIYSKALNILRLNNEYSEVLLVVVGELKSFDYFDVALLLLDEIIRIDDKDPGKYNLRGAINRRNNDVNGAINDYNKSIEIDAYNKSAWYGLGRSLLDAKREDEANVAFIKAVDYGHHKAKKFIKG